MKRLVIAVDCDDVLINTTEYFIDQYNQRYGTRVPIENAYLLSDPEFAAEREQIHERFNEIANSDAFGRLVPRSDAIEVVARLARQHELHLVTARQLSQELVTLRMLNRYFQECFTEINHIHEGSKGEICLAIGADILIDDNAKHLIDAKRCGVEGRIWFGAYPWQEHDRGFSELTERVSDWHEAERVVMRLAGVAE